MRLYRVLFRGPSVHVCRLPVVAVVLLWMALAARSLPMSLATTGMAASPSPPGDAPTLSVLAVCQPAGELPTGLTAQSLDERLVALTIPIELEHEDTTHGGPGAFSIALLPPHPTGDTAGRPTGDNLPSVLALAGLLLIPLDNETVEHAPRVQRGEPLDGYTSTLNRFGTVQGLAPVVGTLYLIGDGYDRASVRMAMSALLNAGVITEGVKRLTGRARPYVTGESGEFAGPGLRESGYTSFPSGHTAVAFAVATVMADRYPKCRWLCYAIATGVGLARIRSSAHFPSDVLVGAGVGIYAGRNALNHEFRVLSLKF